MIDLSKANEWQYIDKETGLVFPWYVLPAIEEISEWHLSNKNVFEYGLGASSLWWEKKCNHLYGVENDFGYFEAVAEKIGTTAALIYEPDLEKYNYRIFEFNISYDIVIVDGTTEVRDSGIIEGYKALKSGGAMIVDNWDQPSCWIPNDQTRRFVNDHFLTQKIYKQKNHADWQTAIFIK